LNYKYIYISLLRFNSRYNDLSSKPRTRKPIPIIYSGVLIKL